MYPLGSSTTPEPALWSGRPCGAGGPGGIGGGVGNSPPPGSSPPPGGPPKGPGGNPRRRPLSPPPVTAMFTTAGVTFFTISENPWATSVGGTPAAVAVGSPWYPVARETARTSAPPKRIRFTMTAFLHERVVRLTKADKSG